MMMRVNVKDPEPCQIGCPLHLTLCVRCSSRVSVIIEVSSRMLGSGSIRTKAVFGDLYFQSLHISFVVIM